MLEPLWTRNFPQRALWAMALLALAGCDLPSDVIIDPQEGVCGNRVCEEDETRVSCPADCPVPDPVDENNNDNTTECVNGESDCPLGEVCIDGQCASPADPNQGEPSCGNGQCETEETADNCPEDCTASPIGCGQGCGTDANCDDHDPCTLDSCVLGTGFCTGLMICENTPMQCPNGQTCNQGTCTP